MAEFREFARAKINLTLRVLGRRPDGYHQIESLVAFADAGDRVVLDTEGSTQLDVSGPFASAIAGANLVSKALRLLAQAEPRLLTGQVRLEKNLPVSSGLGGGSADAAALLRAVAKANSALYEDVPWRVIAARLGADVPVCFENSAAIMRGIGEIVEPLGRMATLNVVLVNPMCEVPADKTAQVFAAFDAPPVSAGRGAGLKVAGALLRSELLALMRQTGNDLYAAACEVIPDIVAVTSALERLEGAELVQLSGAGPTCIAVFAAGEDAEEAAAKLRADYPGWWVQAAKVS